MNVFDKICAVSSFALGALFLLLGIGGLFIGCKAHFTLPPILGIAPAFVGWGIVKPIVVAWKKKDSPRQDIPSVQGNFPPTVHQ